MLCQHESNEIDTVRLAEYLESVEESDTRYETLQRHVSQPTQSDTSSPFDMLQVPGEEAANANRGYRR
jgi:hypothetical protein